MKREFKNFCNYRLLFGISYSLMIPIIPLYFKSIGMTTVTIGMLMSLFGVAKTLIQVPAGVISDKVGDKISLTIGMLLMSFIPLGYIYSNGNLRIGIIYVMQGIILGMMAPATYSVLSRSIDINRRGESTGLASAVFTIGGGIGAAVAGYIVNKLNDYNSVFYLAAIGIVISLVYIILNIKKSKVIKKESKEKYKTIDIIKEIISKKLQYKIIVLGICAFLGDYIYSSIVGLFHFYGQEVLNVTTVYTSSIISIYLIVFGLAAPIAGWVSDRIGNKKQLLISLLSMNITLLILVITRQICIFTFTIALYFLAATFLNAAVQSSLSEFGKDYKIKGFIFGFVGASESLGSAIGPLISSYLYNINKSTLFTGALIVSVIITAILVKFYNKIRELRMG